jgi:uncharacterized protein (DUF2164 family)
VLDVSCKYKPWLVDQVHAHAATASSFFAAPLNSLLYLQGLRDAATQQLSAMEAAVAGAAAAQAERFGAMLSLLSSIGKRKAAEHVRMAADMAALQAQLDGIGAAAAERAAQLEAAGAAGLACLGAQHAAFLVDAQAAAAAAAQQLAAAQAALSAGQASEQQLLFTFLTEQSEAALAVHEATAAMATMAGQHMGETNAAAAAARGQVAERLEAATDAVDAFESSFLAKTQAEQAALVEQIGGMLARWVIGWKGKEGEDGKGMEGLLVDVKSRWWWCQPGGLGERRRSEGQGWTRNGRGCLLGGQICWWWQLSKRARCLGWQAMRFATLSLPRC